MCAGRQSVSENSEIQSVTETQTQRESVCVCVGRQKGTETETETETEIERVCVRRQTECTRDRDKR